MVNSFAEERAGVMRAVKRPAINPAFDNLGAGPGGGLFTRTTPGGEDDEVIVIVDDVLNTSPGSSVRSLAISVQPDETDIDVAITPAVVVHALNSLGQVAAGYNGNVTIAIANNPTTAVLSGTLTVAAVAGVATFSNLKLSRSGEGFTLRASDATGLRQPISTAFNIPTRLVFTDQPVSTTPATVMTAVEVTIQDPGGNVDPNYTGDVTLTLFATSGSGVLSGTTTKAAVAGVATFSDLQVSAIGTYDLLAEAESISGCYPPSRQFSSSFTISESTHTLVAEENLGIAWGYSSIEGFGSLTPTTFGGQTITVLYTDMFAGTIMVVGALVSQNFFTSITFNGMTLLSSAATFNTFATSSQWEWPSDFMFSAAGTFPGEIV